MNTNFYSLWFDPTGNRNRVYRFSGRRSIHSTTDRLLFKKLFKKTEKLLFKKLKTLSSFFIDIEITPYSTRGITDLKNLRTPRYTAACALLKGVDGFFCLLCLVEQYFCGKQSTKRIEVINNPPGNCLSNSCILGL